jgi:hypothetical protein
MLGSADLVEEISVGSDKIIKVWWKFAVWLQSKLSISCATKRGRNHMTLCNYNPGIHFDTKIENITGIFSLAINQLFMIYDNYSFHASRIHRNSPEVFFVLGSLIITFHR